MPSEMSLGNIRSIAHKFTKLFQKKLPFAVFACRCGMLAGTSWATAVFFCMVYLNTIYENITRFPCGF